MATICLKCKFCLVDYPHLCSLGEEQRDYVTGEMKTANPPCRAKNQHGLCPDFEPKPLVGVHLDALGRPFGVLDVLLYVDKDSSGRVNCCDVFLPRELVHDVRDNCTDLNGHLGVGRVPLSLTGTIGAPVTCLYKLGIGVNEYNRLTS